MQFHTILSVLFFFILDLFGGVSARPLTPRFLVDRLANVTDLSLGNPATGYRSSVYFANWGVYERNFHVQDLPANRITHINYAFANVNATTSEVFLSDPWADIQYIYPTDNQNEPGNNIYGSIKQLNLLKKRNRNLKVLLAIGGSTYSPNFAPACSTGAGRKNFAKTAVELVKNLGFDGLDIDWEFPSGPTEVNNFVLLLQAIRAELNAYARKYQAAKPLLTIATSAGPNTYKTSYDFSGLNAVVDFFSLMAYEYTGSWSSFTGHHANLDPSQIPNSAPLNTANALTYYTTTGQIPANKILLGMPLFGKGFDNTPGMGLPFSGVGNGSWDAGIWDYKDLPRPGAVESVDHSAAAAWCQGEDLVVSYDNGETAELKARFISGRALGGGMWWEASGDKKGEDSLITKVTDIIGGTTLKALDQSANTVTYPGSVYDNVRNGFPGE
ncbi:hypothetical protein GP486_004746 [Trichoglossum hirsutum]|uniref:chitinase n=1 Tax=Trichoglossum hirsutum TaxID=265104 RepID=A0A9P8LAH9_9PEZI|nr:hypothetical protein GP486_004746 [Trichoglossum hirsutum]